MKSGPLIACPGCGVELPDKGMAPGERFHATSACQVRFAELSGFTLSMYDPSFIHQLAVDAYSAQHVGPETKPIMAVFALIGLCLAVEHGFTGLQVQRVHMKIPKQHWPKLDPPYLDAGMTVSDVLEAKTDSRLKENILTWAACVWEIWSRHHPWIREQVQPYLVMQSLPI